MRYSPSSLFHFLVWIATCKPLKKPVEKGWKKSEGAENSNYRVICPLNQWFDSRFLTLMNISYLDFGTSIDHSVFQLPISSLKRQVDNSKAIYSTHCIIHNTSLRHRCPTVFQHHMPLESKHTDWILRLNLLRSISRTSSAYPEFSLFDLKSRIIWIIL